MFDGHGGAACADFLRDQMHLYIINEDDYPNNPKSAIEKAVYKIE